MKVEVIVALVTALSAIVVAVISLISSRTSQKASLQAAADLEQLRASLAAHATREADARQRRQEIVRSLHESVQVSQRVKDHVQLFLTAVPHSVLATSALKMIEEARLTLTECYEREMPRLEQTDSTTFHKAKNVTIAIEMRLRQALERSKDVADLTSTDREALSRLREQLTECQTALRDSLLRRAL
jgi:hypothetical protein